MKVLELFAGIGSVRKALEEEGFNVSFTAVEFDKYSVCAYNAIFKDNVVPLDIKDVNFKKGDFDTIVGGFPCQDISNAGLQQGFGLGTNTRSSLLWEMMRIIRDVQPNNIIFENVKALLSKKFKDDLDDLVAQLEELGYSVTYKVTNGINHGIPQQRERVIIVCTKKGKFNFDNKYNEVNYKPLKYFLDDSDNYLSYETLKRIDSWKSFQKPLKRIIPVGGIIPTITTRCYDIQTSSMILINANDFSDTNKNIIGTKYPSTIRPLTVLEQWRLTGFKDNDYLRAKENLRLNYPKLTDRGIDQRLSKMAGNSIIVDVLKDVVNDLYNT